MKNRWTVLALADLEHIAEYIALENEEAARTVVRQIRTAVQRLETFPNSGRPGMEGTRELIVHGTSYIIPYRINESEGLIELLRVLHSSQKRP